MPAWSIRRNTMDYPAVKYNRIEDNSIINIEGHSDAYSRNSISEEKMYASCLCYYIKMFVCQLVKCFDWFVSGAIQLILYVYWKIAQRYPNFLEKQIRNPGDLECLQDEIHMLKQQTISNTECIQRLHDDLDSERRKNKDLRNDKNVLEDEKQDALRRLSELVSVRLRDNNPNIVDLNDRCRPTKLAEMFSELYDNEWTSAFTVLEGLGEERAIVILLNIVTKAYGVCEERVAEPWETLTEWFLDMNIPGAQQASKWLKDSRKANIKNKIPKVEKEYEAMLLTTYKETDVAKALSGQDMKCYITKCIELCLLMVTTDPPVVLKCPGWTTEIKKHEKDRNVQQLSRDETLARGSKRERELFDKDLFKEYTTRGQYLDYVVWPALFLHEDGPMLSKGIAQGSSEKYRDSMENI